MPSTEYFTTFTLERGFFRITWIGGSFLLEFVESPERAIRLRDDLPSIEAARDSICFRKSGLPVWDDEVDQSPISLDDPRWQRHPVRFVGPHRE